MFLRSGKRTKGREEKVRNLSKQKIEWARQERKKSQARKKRLTGASAQPQLAEDATQRQDCTLDESPSHDQFAISGLADSARGGIYRARIGTSEVIPQQPPAFAADLSQNYHYGTPLQPYNNQDWLQPSIPESQQLGQIHLFGDEDMFNPISDKTYSSRSDYGAPAYVGGEFNPHTLLNTHSSLDASFNDPGVREEARGPQQEEAGAAYLSPSSLNINDSIYGYINTNQQGRGMLTPSSATNRVNNILGGINQQQDDSRLHTASSHAGTIPKSSRALDSAYGLPVRSSAADTLRNVASCSASTVGHSANTGFFSPNPWFNYIATTSGTTKNAIPQVNTLSGSANTATSSVYNRPILSEGVYSAANMRSKEGEVDLRALNEAFDRLDTSDDIRKNVISKHQNFTDMLSSHSQKINEDDDEEYETESTSPVYDEPPKSDSSMYNLPLFARKEQVDARLRELRAMIESREKASVTTATTSSILTLPPVTTTATTLSSNPWSNSNNTTTTNLINPWNSSLYNTASTAATTNSTFTFNAGGATKHIPMTSGPLYNNTQNIVNKPITTANSMGPSLISQNANAINRQQALIHQQAMYMQQQSHLVREQQAVLRQQQNTIANQKQSPQLIQLNSQLQQQINQLEHEHHRLVAKHAQQDVLQQRLLHSQQQALLQQQQQRQHEVEQNAIQQQRMVQENYKKQQELQTYLYHQLQQQQQIQQQVNQQLLLQSQLQSNANQRQGNVMLTHAPNTNRIWLPKHIEPPLFSGPNDKISALDFIEKLEIYITSSDIPQEILMRQVLPPLLSEDAKMWYNTHQNFTSYQDFKTRFLKFFTAPDYMQQLYEQFLRRTQHEEEPITHYALIIQNFFKKLKINASDEVIINRIISKLCPKFVKYFCYKKFQNMEEFEDYILSINNGVAMKKAYIPPPPPSECIEPTLAWNNNPRSEKETRGPSPRPFMGPDIRREYQSPERRYSDNPRYYRSPDRRPITGQGGRFTPERFRSPERRADGDQRDKSRQYERQHSRERTENNSGDQRQRENQRPPSRERQPERYAEGERRRVSFEPRQRSPSPAPVRRQDDVRCWACGEKGHVSYSCVNNVRNNPNTKN